MKLALAAHLCWLSLALLALGIVACGDDLLEGEQPPGTGAFNPGPPGDGNGYGYGTGSGANHTGTGDRADRVDRVDRVARGHRRAKRSSDAAPTSSPLLASRKR